MHVQMAPARFGPVCMLLVREFDGNRNQAPMADATLGNDMPREIPHVTHRAFQYRDFQTAVVVQMNVQ